MNYKIEKFDKFSDSRGDLIVFLKQGELPTNKKKFGQIYFVTFCKKGIIRGNHYHKKWTEWFGVIEGKLEVILEDINTKERKTFIFDSKENKYTRLAIGPNIIHSFRSLSNYAALLNYADSEWSEADTYRAELMK
jgi:dTDP-4-dehydrorhamnose 3,5-epimerase-like enzyme